MATYFVCTQSNWQGEDFRIQDWFNDKASASALADKFEAGNNGDIAGDVTVKLWTKTQTFRHFGVRHYADLAPYFSSELNEKYFQMTTAEAAEALGITRSLVLRFIRQGRIKTTMRGRDHWISTAEVERFKALPRTKGRKRKPPMG